MIWFGWVWWYISHCRLFNTKSSLYIYIKYIWFALVLWHINHCGLYNSKSYLYIYQIYMICFGLVWWHISHWKLFNSKSYLYSYGPPHMAVQKQDDQHEHTFSNYVRIQDVVLKTCLRRWTIGKSGERGSGISVLPARHDDDIYIYIYIFWICWKINGRKNIFGVDENLFSLPTCVLT